MMAFLLFFFFETAAGGSWLNLALSTCCTRRRFFWANQLFLLLAALVLTGCSPSAGLPAGQTSPPPAAAAQPQPAAEPLAVSVSPERSCYQQLYDQPEDPNWALYAEITVTNQTDEPLSIETIYLYPNHQFYGEAASTPYLLPEAATVALRPGLFCWCWFFRRVTGGWAPAAGEGGRRG